MKTSFTSLGTAALVVLNLLTSTLAPAAVLGDADGDGNVTTFDVSLFRMHIIGKRILPPEVVACGDINGDGKLTTLDLFLIRRAILKGEQPTRTSSQEEVADIPLVVVVPTVVTPLQGPAAGINRPEFITVSQEAPAAVKVESIAPLVTLNITAGDETITGGKLICSIASNLKVADIDTQMALSIGDEIILGTFVVLEDFYDHVGTVEFDLTGVEVLKGETKKAILLGKISNPCWIQARKEGGYMVGQTSQTKFLFGGRDLFGVTTVAP